MIVFANGRLVAKNNEGETSSLAAVGAESDALKVRDQDQSTL